MRRGPGQRSLVVVVLGVSVLLASCGRACGRRPMGGGGNEDPNPAGGQFFMKQPVNFCWERPQSLRRGTAQTLIDSSGSMVGFTKVAPQLVNWVQHGISQVQKSSMEVESSRLCQFNQSIGVADCTAAGQKPAGFRAFANTNLHDAIRSAKDYSLTFILTDGVAATGGVGAGDCAGGVDAACVARALREVAHERTTTGAGNDMGIWVMPLIASYEGKFYTEERVAPADFNPEEAVQSVRRDVQAEAVIQNPHAGSDGRLEFTYNGPRALLLIVIANWSDVGRNAVQALWERAEYQGVRRMETMSGFSNGMAASPPIELYPGHLNQVRWDVLKEPQEPSEASGTMDAVLKTSPGGNTAIGVTCPPKDTGAGVYRLTGVTAEASRASGCAPIRMLPGFDFQLSAVRPTDEDDLARFLTGYDRSGDSFTELRLDLACSMDIPRPCNSNPIGLSWTAGMNYAAAADALASDAGGHPMHQQVKEISTVSLSREPHRVFAFSTMLENFYREVGQDKKSVVLGDLNICHGP